MPAGGLKCRNMHLFRAESFALLETYIDKGGEKVAGNPSETDSVLFGGAEYFSDGQKAEGGDKRASSSYYDWGSGT